jgi:hypothetical protein
VAVQAVVTQRATPVHQVAVAQVAFFQDLLHSVLAIHLL